MTPSLWVETTMLRRAPVLSNRPACTELPAGALRQTAQPADSHVERGRVGEYSEVADARQDLHLSARSVGRENSPHRLGIVCLVVGSHQDKVGAPSARMSFWYL